MYRFILVILLSFVVSSELPQGLTEWEKDNMHIIDEMRFRTDPRHGPVRNVAEYEPTTNVYPVVQSPQSQSPKSAQLSLCDIKYCSEDKFNPTPTSCSNVVEPEKRPKVLGF